MKWGIQARARVIVQHPMIIKQRSGGHQAIKYVEKKANIEFSYL